KIGKKHYFIENKETQTWSDAVQKCKEMNGHLVSIQNKEEWSDLKEALNPDHSYWADIQTIPEFSINYDDNEPKLATGEKNCVEFTTDYYDFGMDFEACSDRKYYICESNDI
ncbi:hypothetical protein KR059_006207, partial [Drosophila kikkawai]